MNPSRLAARLSRVTTSGRYIGEIDGLRFVAIASVFAFHLATSRTMRGGPHYDIAAHSGAVAAVLGAGNFGVQAFFVISGLVLALPFVGHARYGQPPVRIGRYYLRRLTRLEPPYFVAMTIAFVLLITVRRASAAALWRHLLIGFVYLNNVTYATDNPINAVAWSLEVEVEFYLLVPLLAIVFHLRNPIVRRGALVAGIVLWTLAGPVIAAQNPHLRDTLLGYGQYFFTGFLLADLFCAGRLHRSLHPARWDIAAALAAVVVIVLHISADQRIRPLIGGPAGLIDRASMCMLPFALLVAFAGAFKGAALHWAITRTWVMTFGGMCYSIYLLHDVVLTYALPVAGRALDTGDFAANLALQTALMTAAVAVLSAIFFVLIERPCMDRTWPARLRDRVARYLRPAVTAPLGRDRRAGP